MINRLNSTFYEKLQGKTMPVMEMSHELNGSRIIGVGKLNVLTDLDQGKVTITISDRRNHHEYEGTTFEVSKNGLIQITSSLDRDDPGLHAVEDRIINTVQNILDKDAAIETRINEAQVVAGVNMETLSWFAIKSLDNMRDDNGNFTLEDESMTPLKTTFKDAYKEDIFTVSAGVREDDAGIAEPYFQIQYSEKYGGRNFEISGQKLNRTLDQMRNGNWHKDRSVKALVKDALKINFAKISVEDRKIMNDNLDKKELMGNVSNMRLMWNDIKSSGIDTKQAPTSSSYEMENENGFTIEDIAKEYIHYVYNHEVEPKLEISTAKISSRHLNDAIQSGLEMEKDLREQEAVEKLLDKIVNGDIEPSKDEEFKQDEKAFDILEKESKINTSLWKDLAEYNKEKKEILNEYKDKANVINNEIKRLRNEEKDPNKREAKILSQEYKLKALTLRTDMILNDKLSKAADYVQSVERFRYNVNKFMNSMFDFAKRCVEIPASFALKLSQNIYEKAIEPMMKSAIKVSQKAHILGIDSLATINITRRHVLELAKASQAFMDWDKNQSKTLEEIVCNKMDDYTFKANMKNECDVSNFDARMRNTFMQYDALSGEYNKLLQYKRDIDDEKSNIPEMDRMKYDGVYGDTIKSHMYFVQGVSNDLKIYLNDTFSVKNRHDENNINHLDNEINRDAIDGELKKIIENNLNKELPGSDGKLLKDFMPDVLKTENALDDFRNDIIDSIPLISGRLNANETLKEQIQQIRKDANDHINEIVNNKDKDDRNTNSKNDEFNR